LLGESSGRKSLKLNAFELIEPTTRRGIIVIAERLPMSDPWRKNTCEPFKKLMKTKYGPNTEINPFHAAIYDAFWVTLNSVKAAGTDNRAAVRDAIEKIRFDGMMRLFACTPTDHQGTPIDTMPQAMVKNGEYVPHKK
jgi:branched-chain amino acid transport system substrate-binding protein